MVVNAPWDDKQVECLRLEACHGDILTYWADRLAQARGIIPKTQPIARTNDPWTSKVAATRIEPKRGTRKAAVLELLQKANGAWVDGPDILTVGGSEGLRRLRELRA